MQIQYGLFAVAVALQNSLARYCVIQVMEPYIDGETVTNEFDCPLFTLSDNFFALSPECIQTSVSFVHQCTNTCHFVVSQSSNFVTCERE